MTEEKTEETPAVEVDTTPHVIDWAEVSQHLSDQLTSMTQRAEVAEAQFLALLNQLKTAQATIASLQMKLRAKDGE